jgi:hypothetical protein
MDTLEDSRDVKTYSLGVLCAQFLRRTDECFTYCPHYHFIAALTRHITISQTCYIVINYRTSSSLYSTKDTGVVIQTNIYNLLHDIVPRKSQGTVRALILLCKSWSPGELL